MITRWTRRIRGRLQQGVNLRQVHLVELRDATALRLVELSDGITVTAVTTENVDRAGDFRASKTVRLFRDLLAAGHLGAYAWADGQVVGHFWGLRCHQRRCRQWGGVDFHRGEVLLAWGHVREDLRGRRIFQALIAELARRALAEPDVCRVLADVPLEPPASLRAHVRAGFTYAGRLRYVRVAGILVARRFTPARPGDFERWARR